GRDALQNRVDLFRHTKTFTEDLLHILACFQSFHHGLESIDQLKNSNLARRNGSCRSGDDPDSRMKILSCSSARRLSSAAASLNFLYSISCRISSHRGSSSAASSSGGC